MVDQAKLILLIEEALQEVDVVVVKSDYYKEGEEPILSTRKVLNLLKDGLTQDASSINNRILRAMHDVGMSSYKDFENTSLEIAINKVTEVLYKEMPGYKNLKPLRGEFGHGDPI